MVEKNPNPWPGLAQQAHEGNLELAPGAAGEAAKFAAEVANALGVALAYQPLLVAHRGFSDNGHLKMVRVLQDRFNAQGQNLGDIVKRYIELVEGMADVMITADKNYNSVEEDSKTKFTRFKNETHDAAGFPTGDPKIVSGTKIPVWNDEAAPPLDSKHGHQNLEKVAKENGHYEAIDPEDPNGKDRVWFHAAGEGMNPQLVADTGGTWLLVAEKIDTAFNHLTTRLHQMEADKSWTGQGAQGAIKAAQDFKIEADGLTADIRSMAGNLNYVSGWLSNTKVAMPSAPTDFDYDHPAREDRIINAARLAFQRWYVTGLIAASPAVPKLGNPTAYLPAVAPQGRTTSDDTRGGGGTSSKSGLTGASLSADSLNSNKSNPNQKSPQGTDQNKNPNQNDPNKTDPNKTDPNGNGNDPGKNDPNKTDPGKSGPNGTDPGKSSETGTSQQSSNGSQDGSQLSSALQQGMQALTSATNPQKTNDPNSTLAGIPNLLNSLSKDLAKGGGSPGGGGAGISPAAAPKELTARLFPRAALTAEVEGAIATSRAGIATAGAAPMGGMGGAPMGGGHGAGGHGGQGKEHKRPEFLDSTEYLEEAMGAAPIVAKPVVEG
ncbi:hypothetical protein [Nocardia sp. NPDC056000]|uniref:hypothetical protein n=1 Tax=Nocardia sp. NPDC056000 TaxID=3345674 RepID=UPI0035E1ACB6